MSKVRRLRSSRACVGGLALLMFGVSACDGTHPANLSNVTAISIATNWEKSCAVRRDGKVLCWGVNSGELAVDIDGISGAIDVSIGNGFACARLADGTVQCWGDGYGGTLGNGTTTDLAGAMASVLGITSATALSVGYGHACAVLAGGMIQCWGGNSNGQLGTGSQTDSGVPSTVTGITQAKSISAGRYGTCAVILDGTVQCWGENTYGQLGDGTTTDSSVPVTVSGLTGAVGVCTSVDHSCAVLEDGTVQCWGANAFGENGSGAPTGSLVPSAVTGITDASAVTCGYDHTCALASDGSVQCWGADSFGALGDSTETLNCTWDPDPPSPYSPAPTISYETTCAPTPVPVSGVTGATSVVAGFHGACAVVTEGSVQCWGYNQFGQLGDGSTSNSPSPVGVMAQSGQ